MALQVIAEKISVYEITGKNELGQPTAVDHIYQRGQVIPDWLDSHQAFVLTSTGLAAEVGDHPDGALRPLNDQLTPVILPEHNPRTIPGSGATGPMVVTDSVDETDQNSGNAGDKSNAAKSNAAKSDNDEVPAMANGELEPLPADTAAKPVWEDYAVQKLPGDLALDRAQAESMTKAKLLTEVKQRYNDAADRDEQPGGETLPPSFK